LFFFFFWNTHFVFSGSAWVALTHEFVEYCVWGWDNLPRTLLMYYTNFLSSPEGYFQTVICNAQKFSHTVANHDLHFISWDNPPKQHPHSLTMADKEKMILSNAPFARKFKHNDPVLDAIDAELLGRSMNGTNGFVPGGWCKGTPTCSKVGDSLHLTPGSGAQRLAQLIEIIVRSKAFSENQCK
jgi:Core-2/I-Branching enzyme